MVRQPMATVASLQRFGLVLLINYVRLIMNATSADELLTVVSLIGHLWIFMNNRPFAASA